MFALLLLMAVQLTNAFTKLHVCMFAYMHEEGEQLVLRLCLIRATSAAAAENAREHKTKQQ